MAQVTAVKQVPSLAWEFLHTMGTAKKKKIVLNNINKKPDNNINSIVIITKIIIVSNLYWGLTIFKAILVTDKYYSI